MTAGWANAKPDMGVGVGDELVEYVRYGRAHMSIRYTVTVGRETRNIPPACTSRFFWIEERVDGAERIVHAYACIPLGAACTFFRSKAMYVRNPDTK